MTMELMRRRVLEAVVVFVAGAFVSGCVGATPVDKTTVQEEDKRPVKLQVLLGPEEEVQVLFIPFQEPVVSRQAWQAGGPDPMDSEFPAWHQEVPAQDVYSEPEDALLEASVALFREALGVLAAHEVAPPQRLAAPAQPVLAFEQVASLSRSAGTDRELEAMGVASSGLAFETDSPIAGLEVRTGALAPRTRRTPEPLHLTPRFVPTTGRVEDL